MPRDPEATSTRHFAKNAMCTLVDVWWIIFGIEFLLEGLGPGAQTSSAVSHFPQYVSIFSGLLFIAGGYITLWSLFTQDINLTKVFQWRKAGFTAAAFAGGIYAYYTLKYVPLEVVALSFGLWHMSLGVAGLFMAIFAERREREKRAPSQGGL